MPRTWGSAVNREHKKRREEAKKRKREAAKRSKQLRSFNRGRAGRAFL